MSTDNTLNKSFRRLAQILLIATLSFSLVGCGSVSEETLSEILEWDPAFEEALNAKKRISAKIAALETERDSIKSQIAALKDNLKPEIQSIKAKLEKTHTEYALKKKEHGNSLAKLKNIKKLLEKKGELALSADEISIWQTRVGRLEEEIASSRKTLDKLRNKSRLLKTEITILRK